MLVHQQQRIIPELDGVTAAKSRRAAGAWQQRREWSTGAGGRIVRCPAAGIQQTSRAVPCAHNESRVGQHRVIWESDAVRLSDLLILQTLFALNHKTLCYRFKPGYDIQTRRPGFNSHFTTAYIPGMWPTRPLIHLKPRVLQYDVIQRYSILPSLLLNNTRYFYSKYFIRGWKAPAGTEPNCRLWQLLAHLRRELITDWESGFYKQSAENMWLDVITAVAMSSLVFWTVTCRYVRIWGWRGYVPSKRWHLQGVIIQTTNFDSPN